MVTLWSYPITLYNIINTSSEKYCLAAFILTDPYTQVLNLSFMIRSLTVVVKSYGHTHSKKGAKIRFDQLEIDPQTDFFRQGIRWTKCEHNVLFYLDLFSRLLSIHSSDFTIFFNFVYIWCLYISKSSLISLITYSLRVSLPTDQSQKSSIRGEADLQLGLNCHATNGENHSKVSLAAIQTKRAASWNSNPESSCSSIIGWMLFKSPKRWPHWNRQILHTFHTE